MTEILNVGKEREDRLIRLLLSITIILTLLNVFIGVIEKFSWQITRLIYVNFESNLPTWFSSIILAIAALYAYKCSIISNPKQGGRRMWQLLSLGLLFMSCDEVAMIHENLGTVLNKYIFKLECIKNTPWPIFLGPLVLTALVMFILKIRRYMKGSTKAVRYLLAGTAIFIAGAFILEATINLITDDSKWLWDIEVIVEEFLEMTGVILIIKGLQEHCRFLSARHCEE